VAPDVAWAPGCGGLAGLRRGRVYSEVPEGQKMPEGLTSAEMKQVVWGKPGEMSETIHEGDDEAEERKRKAGIRGRHSFSPSYQTYRPPPSDFKLLHTAVFVRHGDRTPISRGVGTAMNVDHDRELWESLLPSEDDARSWDSQNPVVPKEISSKPYDLGRAPYGQLTRQGASECVDIGKDLRKRYIDDMEFLPKTFDLDKMKIRSTNLRRTQQTAQNLLLGLYPPESRPSGEKESQIPIKTMPIEDETLIPNAGGKCERCAKLTGELALAARGMTFVKKAEREMMRGLGYPPGGVRWAQAREVMTCYLLQNRTLPNGLTADDVDRMGEVNSVIWGAQYNDMDVGRLATGRIFMEVYEDMETAIDDCEDCNKISIYAGHDSTLVPILCSLGVFDDTWPPYASNIVLELAEDSKGKHHVRVMYNNADTLITDGFWNEYEDFWNYMGFYMTTDEQWREECKQEGDHLGLPKNWPPKDVSGLTDTIRGN